MGGIIKYFSLFLLVWIISCCNSDQEPDNNRKISSFEKHVKYHENGNIRIMYFTDRNNEIVNPLINFDSLGRLKDSTWIDDDEVWEYQKLYSNGKLTAILDNYIYDDYLNMKYIKIDKYGDTVFHKSEYCEIYSLGDTVALDEDFLFNLVCYSPFGDIMNLKIGNYDKSYKLIDSINYIELNLKVKDYEFFTYKPVKEGVNKLRAIVEIKDSVDLNEDGKMESTTGSDYYLQYEFFATDEEIAKGDTTGGNKIETIDKSTKNNNK